MDILGLGSSEKDVLISFAAASAAKKLLHDLDNDLRGHTGGAGIVVCVPVSGLNSLVANLAAYHAEGVKKEEKEMERTENSLILVVCARGCTDDVMATAKAHGARGGTVVRGRLSGQKLTRLFGRQNAGALFLHGLPILDCKCLHMCLSETSESTQTCRFLDLFRERR